MDFPRHLAIGLPGVISFRALALLLAFLLPGAAEPMAAQGVARFRVAENVRADPNGELIARFNPGTEVVVEGSEGEWTRVTFEGWIWLASVQERRTGAWDLSVTAGGGENFRTAPRGRILGRLERGTLLEELERVPGWARVRRTAWVWTASIERREAASAAPAPGTSRAAGAPSPPASTEAAGWIEVGGTGGAILASPDGDTLGRAAPGGRLQRLGREGNWTRVRMEGWIWAPRDDDGGRPSSRTPAEVRADPGEARGEIVRWTLQYISLERADRLRSDFYEGERYLLTRAEGGYVYVALPPERSGEFDGLAPLEEILVTGRVRSGAADFTGNPVLDLLEWGRASR